MKKLLIKQRSILMDNIKEKFKKFYSISKEIKKENRKIKANEEKLLRLKEQAKHIEDELIIFLNNLNDEFVKQILKNHYMKGLTWQATSQTLGGYNTEDCVRKIAERYLTKIEKTYGGKNNG